MADLLTAPVVVAVAANPRHTFSKGPRESICLLAGLGVEGDAHSGATMKHRSRWARQRDAPNTRQVHLIGAEVLEMLAGLGFAIQPGDIGENVTTRGLDLLALPTGTALTLGQGAVVEITGLRNPCVQLDRFRPGLMQAVLGRGADGSLVRKAGVMGIVRMGGEVRPGDPIAVALPTPPHRPLKPV